ncbi:hypothetical protein B2G74_11995 [Burkholderia sp. A27]|nr:hypothetical protein B2G74_11995 [Burkholderia sp. A27]
MRVAFVRLFQWAGLGGGTFGCAGCLRDRSVNPALCPPTPFDSGERVNRSRKRSPHAPVHARPYRATFPPY